MSERDAVIEVRRLVKTFEKGLIRALDGVDFTVNSGEFVAVVGPSGCGKSTLLHLIAALDRPDAGRITVSGRPLDRERDLSRYRAREVGLVFQLDNLLPTLSASENVQVPMFEAGLPAPQRRSRASRLLAQVGLAHREKNRPAELSGGERQRVAIARALANDPSILLADEPTGRLDSKSAAGVLELMGQLQRSRGLTVVLVTHDPQVAGRAQRIVRMLDGRILDDHDLAPRAPAFAGTAAPPS